MPDTLDRLPILRELGDELDAAFREREASTRRRRRRRFAAVPAAAAVAIAVLIALPAGDETAPRSLRVLDAVAAIAATAAQQPPAAPPGGGYAYFRERGAAPESRDSTEWWVAADGSGRVRQRYYIGNDFERPANDPGLRYLVRPSNDPGARWRRAGGGNWVRDVRFGPGRFERLYNTIRAGVLELEIADLPSDPDALAAALRRELEAAARDDDPESGFAPGSGAPSMHMLTVIDQLLAHPLATPAQRSALFRVAGTLEGVEAAEGVKDPIGRPATVVRLTANGMGIEVYFDSETSSALGRRHTHGSGIDDWSAFTASATVDSIRARP